MNSRLCSIVMALIITVFSGVDTVNTLYIVANGGTEVNPFMGYLLDKNVLTFIVGKFTITSIGLAVLVYYKQYKVLAGIMFIYILLMFHQAVIIWSI